MAHPFQPFALLKSNASLFVYWVTLVFTLGMRNEAKSQSCCSLYGMQAFAKNERFVNMHDMRTDPPALETGINLLQFSCPDGKPAYMHIRYGTGTQVLFLFHEWWGVNDYMKEQINRFHASFDGKVNVVCLDMYDKKIAGSREEASNLMNGLSEARAKAIMQGSLAVLKDAPFATLGWCMGGGFSLQAALLGESRCKACVMYYGMPVMEDEKLKGLHAPVLNILAQRDQWITPELIAQFETCMKRLNKPIEILRYDADHAFANPSNPRYLEKNAQDAEVKSIEFIRNNAGF